DQRDILGMRAVVAEIGKREIGAPGEIAGAAIVRLVRELRTDNTDVAQQGGHYSQPLSTVSSAGLASPWKAWSISFRLGPNSMVSVSRSATPGRYSFASLNSAVSDVCAGLRRIIGLTARLSAAPFARSARRGSTFRWLDQSIRMSAAAVGCRASAASPSSV